MGKDFDKKKVAKEIFIGALILFLIFEGIVVGVAAAVYHYRTNEYNGLNLQTITIGGIQYRAMKLQLPDGYHYVSVSDVGKKKSVPAMVFFDHIPKNAQIIVDTSDNKLVYDGLSTSLKPYIEMATSYKDGSIVTDGSSVYFVPTKPSMPWDIVAIGAISIGFVVGIAAIDAWNHAEFMGS